VDRDTTKPHLNFQVVVQGAWPARNQKKLKPYWAELGYRLRPDGLFEREFTKLDGTIGYEVLVDAESFHRIRRENLRRLGVWPSSSPTNT
jgi:hypothetical protein